ncbi:MAG: membrane protein insertase YidC [Gemmatimonadota bacterium]
MRTEVRFLLAMVLMLGVLVGTNLLFPPIPPEAGPMADSLAVDSLGVGAAEGDSLAADTGVATSAGAPAEEAGEKAGPLGILGLPDTVPERFVTVEGPLFRHTFTTRGAQVVSAEMLEFQSFRRPGVVDLIPEGAHGYLGNELVVGRDTLDLKKVSFDVEPADGIVLVEGGEPQVLTFTYDRPDIGFRYRIEYAFAPETYAVTVRANVTGLDRPLLVTDLGDGLAFAEVDSVGESRAMAYVANHVQDGIRSWNLHKNEPRILEGPFLWAAFRSKFFVLALLAGETDAEVSGEVPAYLGGILVSPSELPERAEVQVTQSLSVDGSVGYRLFLGPQEYARLSTLGEGMEEVNPYGWKFFRPIVRPFVSIIMTVLTFMHDRLNLGYGWVLIIFGVLMRVVLWPLNQKAMRSQMKNMAVQPLMKEIQAKYKDQPERLQKEMMKLYKEHGFNPLAGCLPMLLPWPVLIALFFVFQNTIELRGVSFFWLPDLSAPDPLYILPILMGASMFVLQWITLRSTDTDNPQMKMMMWIMPIFMMFIFYRLASGLNLYYATANFATLPQQIWLAKERKKLQAKQPVKAEAKAPPKRSD